MDGLSRAEAWAKTRLFWGGERHLAAGGPDSNFRTAWDVTVSKRSVPTENICRIRRKMPSAALAAILYEVELRAMFELDSRQLL